MVFKSWTLAYLTALFLAMTRQCRMSVKRVQPGEWSVTMTSDRRARRVPRIAH